MPSFFATAPKGLEGVLAAELVAAGVPATVERGGASFEGPLALGYRACLHSRVANRVLLALASFPAPDPDALYEGTKAILWEEHLGVDETLAVDFASSHSVIHHTQFGALKVKDAIVDRFRDRIGTRPNVKPEQPSVQVNVHLHHDQATVYLDLSGDSLHRRGYRESSVIAPLKENLAAGILLLARWPELAAQGAAFLDPMCGSGTLPIEAALIAAHIAPGMLRTYWGFLGWTQHDPALWTQLLDEARQLERRDGLPPIVGTDADGRAVRTAVGGSERAGLRGKVHFEKRELAEARPPAGSRSESPAGLICTNPPYGERLGEVRALHALYAELGSVLRDRFERWDAHVLTSVAELASATGLKPERTYELYNGPIACKLYFVPILSKLNRSEPKRPGPAGLPWGSPERAEAFGNRLKKNLKHLRKWAQREGVSCYRLYDKDLPEYAVAVDWYEGWAHVQEYAPPKTVDPVMAQRRLLDLLATIPEALEIPPERVTLKTRERQRGHSQYEKVGEGGEPLVISENRHQFKVNLTDYLDTGLFLDHRLTRAMLGPMAKGKRFLNLFCYTATATVYAAKGGALRSTSVDMSNTYLDWARENFELNHLGAEHRLVRADLVPWLAEPQGAYDLIFLDPPTFSRSKKMEDTFDVQRDHIALLQATVKWLAPGGTLLFSNNFRRFKLDESALPGMRFEDISVETIPPDFARNSRIHRAWKITAR